MSDLRARIEVLADELERCSRGFSGIYAEADREHAATLRAILAAAQSPTPPITDQRGASDE